jgi:glycolate oxidase FAD binding subunit
MLAALRSIVGPDAAANGDRTRALAVDGMTPSCVVSPATTDELRRCVAAIAAADGALIPCGTGSRLAVGRPPRRYDVALSTRRLQRVLAHEAADMTVSVEAGVGLAELNALVGEAGQHLPLDPPHPERTTIGGLIATDASGPLRWSQGKVRDLLIGITVVLADGTLVKGGGRVVKNVAGYDLMKLFTGSYGTLAIIVEATFKVRPLPERTATIIVPAATTAAATATALALLSAPLAPLSVDVVNGAAARHCGLDGPAAVVGCGGLEAEITVQAERLRTHCGDREVRLCDMAQGSQLRVALRDWPAGGNDSVGCRLSVLPSRLPEVLPRLEDEARRHGFDLALLSHVGNGVAVLRLDRVDAATEALPQFADGLRATLRAAGGWAVFDLLSTALKARVDPWGADIPGLELMRRIKQTLDPHARLSPGRFVGGI